MLYLINDPGENYIPKGDYVSFHPNDIPNTASKANTLRVALKSKSILSKRKSVVIYNVNKLNAKQTSLLVGMLYDKHNTVKVVMTSTNEKEVNNHIKNMPGLRHKKIRAPGVKREATFFEKLTSYIQFKKVPETELLLPFVRSMASNQKLSEHNQELLVQIDSLMFETNSEYLTYAWAGLHRRQKIRPSFKSVYKEKEKKVKIDPVVKKTRRAKKKTSVEKKRKVGLHRYF